MPFIRQHCGRLQRAPQARRPELFTGLRSPVPLSSYSGAILTAATEQGAPVLAILDTGRNGVAGGTLVSRKPGKGCLHQV